MDTFSSPSGQLLDAAAIPDFLAGPDLRSKSVRDDLRGADGLRRADAAAGSSLVHDLTDGANLYGFADSRSIFGNP